MVKRLNTATLDELQNVICCSNYRRDYMSEINVYKWEDIRKYFPPERVAEIRAKILELRKSGKYTDRELWEMYGMSERTFYDLVERAKDGSTAEDLKDRPSKPKNPYRKLTDEDKACLLYTSDAADDLLCVDLGGRRIIKKKKKKNNLI